MSEKISVRAYAKINLFLRILSVENGYHKIESFQQSVDLFDEVTLCKSGGKKITSDFPEDNSLVVLKRIAEKYSLGGMRLFVKKNIPIGGGLGGSSADAAAAALACARLWGLDEEEVKALVAPLFGDLAFQLTGGTALTRGFGEIVEPLKPLPEYHVLLCFPKEGVLTKDAYALSDKTPRGDGDPFFVYDALQNKTNATAYYVNDLLPAAALLNKEILPLLGALKDDEACLYGMSGSGSTLFALYTNKEAALKKANSLPCRTLLTRTITPNLAK